MSDASKKGYFLVDKAGEPMTCNVFCRAGVLPGVAKTDERFLAYYFNW